MIEMPWQKKEDDLMEERYALTIERIDRIQSEESISNSLKPYFDFVSAFILRVREVYLAIEDGRFDRLSVQELQKQNKELYTDVLDENYKTSYANPAYAVEILGEAYGQILCLLYTEIRGSIPAAFEGRLEYLTIFNELFIEIYNCFEEEKESDAKEIRKILYWYASDYCEVFMADRLVEQIDPIYSFAAAVIEEADLNEERYLYRFGEYISDNERETARYLQKLPEETIQKMADVYTEGYRIGFVNTGKDLSKKGTVTIQYVIGFERVVKKAIENFAEMGLRPTFVRAPYSVVTKRNHMKNGYRGAIANKQYEYDHRADQALYMDKKLLERRLEVVKTTYEQYKDTAAKLAGPAVIEMFGEKPFQPAIQKEAPIFDEKQEQYLSMYDNKVSQITNVYIKGEERSFTIVAYPVPEISRQYPEIFEEIIRINTLDAKLYEKVQQTLIDALDQGEYVHVLGKAPNRTDLKIHLYPLKNPQKETIFENCVADVNIPVGEVFTSPVLAGTEGVLHVSQVYLKELQYLDLEIAFKEGKITGYTCGNFESEEECRKLVKENILHNHEALPMGEFAIGTNTTAYAAAEKYKIADKLPILIAEKMGPHFAVGDTCYSWSEEIKVYNPNGKEIVARDNEVSLKRLKSVEEAYFQCHTDITIPYEELEEISVITKDGKRIALIAEGKFVLPGTEVLNEPLDGVN